MYQVEVFWAVTLCSVVVGYQCFRGSCCHESLKTHKKNWVGNLNFDSLYFVASWNQEQIMIYLHIHLIFCVLF